MIPIDAQASDSFTGKILSSGCLVENRNPDVEKDSEEMQFRKMAFEISEGFCLIPEHVGTRDFSRVHC
jgi:hypothetical protein